VLRELERLNTEALHFRILNLLTEYARRRRAMADHLRGENRTTATGADPRGKPRRIIRSAAPLLCRFGGSEPNGEIKTLDAETTKG
jgi:hypothetical protein